MTGFLHEKEFSRKSFLKASGGVVVGASLAGAGLAARAEAGGFVPSPATYDPATNAVDSFLYVNPDNTVNLLTSQVEIGNGTPTGFLMIAAEELDLDMSQMRYGSSVYDKDGKLVATVTDGWRAVNTGGHGGSQAIQSVGQQVRAAAATAKQSLLALASKQLGVPAASLSLSKGVVSGGGKSATYAELVAGNGGKIGGTISPTSLQPGVGISKPVADYQLVTKVRVPREDIPAKVTGRYAYVHNIRLPGMLHARWVRPRGQGPWLTDGFASPLKVDAGSIAHIPDIQVVQRQNFLAVVGPKEYDVIQAAEQLKVTWADTPILGGSDNLWSYYRAMDAKGLTPARVTANAGDVDKAFAGAAKVVSGSFAYPYQGHNPIGPGCAVADVRSDQATVFCNTQNVPNLTKEMAQVLGLPANRVRIVWYEGSSTYGNGYHAFDIAESAAIISQLVKAPVRLQLMRWDEQGWTRYGQGFLTDMKIGLDAKGNMVAYEATQTAQASTSLAAAQTLAGIQTPGTPGPAGTNGENLGPFYTVSRTNYRTLAKTVTQQLGMFQQSTLRAPSATQTCFASEQIVDMAAEAAGMDPYSFRAQNMRTDGDFWRWTAVLKAAIDASPYKPHVPASQRQSGDVVEGWGMAIGTHGASRAGTVAQVQVNKKTGKVSVLHLYAGQDSGLAVNPGLIENQMSGNLMQATSKTLFEELRFDKKRVTSTDWVSYPMLRFKDAPAVTTVVVQRTDQLPTGSGEPPQVPAIAAIANAVYDATGVRMWQAPLTPARVRGFLSGAGKSF